MKKISIVIPVYNEGENIQSIYDAVREVDRKYLHEKYEIEMIFSDNHSTDNGFQLISAIHAKDRRVRGIQLSRNFGYQANILTGYLNATGDAVIQLDCDGQDPPSLIVKFIEAWEKGYEVVYGIRQQRKESWIISIQRLFFYRLLKRISPLEIPVDAGDFRLLDRKVINVIRDFRESNPYIRGLISYIGFKQLGIPYERMKRKDGASKFSWFDLLRLGWDGIASFSVAPLRLSIYFGFFCAGLSLMGLCYHFYLYLIHQAAPPGFYTLVTVTLFTAGVQLICIGFLGEYISRIFENVKMRPRSIVKRSIGFDEPPRGA